MTKRKPANGKEPTTVVANDPTDRKGALKTIGGSQSDDWNNTLANQAVQALWVKNSDVQERDRQLKRNEMNLNWNGVPFAGRM